MKSSVNQPWGISKKHVKRYGRTWATTDFILNTLNQEQFRNDPLNVNIGTLKLQGRNIRMKYKHLMSESQRISQLAEAAYMNKLDRDQKYSIELSGNDFSLVKHEITKLAETLADAVSTVQKQYQLNIW